MARPKKHHDERRVTAVRLPVELHDRAKATAEERDVSVNWLVTRALAAYLDGLDAAEGDRR